MFGNGAKVDTLVGQGAEFKGNITVEGSIVIDGRVEGNVAASERVTLGTHGNVRGNLSAPEVVVGGKVQGNISCAERAELMASAQVLGDIRAPRMIMADGAQVSGKVGMEPAAPAENAIELRIAKK
jgi:cytoskeletal protein CcmA (bactofilin family)